MPSPSITYTFSNSTTADAGQVNQNFTDLVNAMSDGTKDFSISALTCAGTATLNGHVNLGNASSDDLTITASLASTIAIKTTNSYNIGSATKGLQYMYFGSSAGANTTRVTGSAVTADAQLILPDVSGTLRLVGDTQSKSTTYTALTTDGLIKCDTSGGAWTLTLYTASGHSGKRLKIKKTTNDANLLTIDGNGSETIDGSTTATLNKQNECIVIQSDGSNWQVVSRYTAGEVVQTVYTSSSAVSTGTTAFPVDDTIPQNTEGSEFMTLAITPTNASNKLIIRVNFFGGCSTATNVGMGLFQDSTAAAIAAVANAATAGGAIIIPLVHQMTAGTTSSTTFKIRLGTTAGNTITINGTGGARLFGGVGVSSIKIQEIRV